MGILKLTQAETIIDAALAEGRKKNLALLAVAVLDAGGHLIAFKREDGATFLRFELAYGKAWGALGMGFGTRELAERAAKNPAFVGALSAVSQGRMVPSPGGVLIAGAGHVRSDRGVPVHLARQIQDASITSVAFVEVDAAAEKPGDYAQRFGSDVLPFHYIWFTPKIDEADPCEKLKKSTETETIGK